PVEHLVTEHNAEVTWLEPDSTGLIRPETLEAALREHADDTALVSVMWANNEVGTVQPIAELSALSREHGITFHTDAVQAPDLVTVTGHKIGGPLGVGLLVAGRDQTPVPLTHGGGQERQLRSGTLDTPAIAGLAVAVRLAVADQEVHAKTMIHLRDRLIEGAL